MALTHSTAAKNAAIDAVVDLIDGGTTDAQGDLVIQTSGDVEVSAHTCNNPAFPNASGGSASANAIADDTNAAGGTAANFIFQDRDNTEVFRGSVSATGGGGDLELSSTSVGAGDTVQIDSFTYNAFA